MKRFFFLSSLVLPFVFLACSDGPPYPKYGDGVLRNGAFTYLCVTPSDAYCAGTENVTTLPPIALGTSFRIAFMQAPEEPPATLDLATLDFLDLAPDGTMHAKRAGYASLFARAPNGDVEDYVNLRVHEVGSILIRGIDAGTTLKSTETRSVRAEPHDQAGAVLAGSATYDWETSDAGVLAIDVSADDRARGGATLRAVGPGTARLRVVLGTSTGTLDVLVGGE
jgi:hypothetical protein